MTPAQVRITNESPRGPAGGPDVIVDTVDLEGLSLTGIEHRLQPQQTVIELVEVGHEVRITPL